MPNSRETAEIKMMQTQATGFFAFVVLYKIKHFFHGLLLQQFAFHKSFHEFYGVCRSTNNSIISFSRSNRYLLQAGKVCRSTNIQYIPVRLREMETIKIDVTKTIISI